MRVLIVEDRAEVRDKLASAMNRAGFLVDTASNMAEACLLATPPVAPDAILLSPHAVGLRLADAPRIMSSRGFNVPLIAIEDGSDGESLVSALRAGFDDYLKAPFNSDEAALRAAAVLRRSQRLPELHVNNLSIDPLHRIAMRDGHPIHLTPKEFDVLLVLVEAGGRHVSRERMLRLAWDTVQDPGTSVVEVLISRLRKKVDAFSPTLVHTHDDGYSLSRRHSLFFGGEMPDAAELRDLRGPVTFSIDERGSFRGVSYDEAISPWISEETIVGTALADHIQGSAVIDIYDEMTRRVRAQPEEFHLTCTCRTSTASGFLVVQILPSLPPGYAEMRARLSGRLADVTPEVGDPGTCTFCHERLPADVARWGPCGNCRRVFDASLSV